MWSILSFLYILFSTTANILWSWVALGLIIVSVYLYLNKSCECSLNNLVHVPPLSYQRNRARNGSFRNRKQRRLVPYQKGYLRNRNKRGGGIVMTNLGTMVHTTDEDPELEAQQNYLEFIE